MTKMVGQKISGNWDLPEFGFQCTSWRAHDKTIGDFLRLIEAEVKIATDSILANSRPYVNFLEDTITVGVFFDSPWDIESPVTVDLVDLIGEEADSVRHGSDHLIHDDEYGRRFATSVAVLEGWLIEIKKSYSEALAQEMKHAQ